MKKAKEHAFAFRGTEQIRTAVGGFADLCLATRPRYLLIPLAKNKAIGLIKMQKQAKIVILSINP